MTSYPPPPMPAAQPGPPPAAPGKTRLRGRRLLQLGVILFIAAVVLFVIGGIGSSKSSDKEKSFQRITPTRLATDSGVAVRVGTGSVTFPKVGGYIAYYEGSDITDKIIPKAAVQITSPSGKPDLLDTLYGALNGNKVKPLEYTYKGTKGAALYEFHISEPGTYSVIVEIKGSAPSGADVAFGKSIGTTEAVGAGFIVGGLLLLLAAIVLFIVGLVKRRRHKKELANPVGYPAFPAGGYPQPGYPQPGFPQSGFPQPGGYAPPSGYPQGGGHPQGGFPQPGGYAPPAPGSEPPPPGYQPPPAPEGYQPPSEEGYQPPPPPA